MKKDPKQFQGQVPPNATYTGERDGSPVEPLAIDLLPSVFRTDTNKKVLGALVEDMFQPAAIENLNYYVGRPTGNSKIKKEKLPRKNSRRQLETGLLVEDSVGTKVLTADDIAIAQGHSDNHLLEQPKAVSVLDLPINPDKFVNWSNYYWLEEGMPVLYIVGTNPNESSTIIDVERDIIGKQHYTLPAQTNGKTLELKNGMRIVFQKTYPNRNNISGDVTETHIADGGFQIDFQHEMSQQYSKSLILVRVDGVEKVRIGDGPNPDYSFTYGSLKWLRDGDSGAVGNKNPPAGAVVEIVLQDYWVSEDRAVGASTTTPSVDRRWQVEGVGTSAGIRLLPRTMQTTNTVYSSTIQSLWDQTTVPWDRIEWDGDIPGINKKHYVLQAPGAINRNANSRVNVWVHKDTIQTVCNYLNIKPEELVNDSKSALRPIIEFDHRLEFYNHGTQYRHWVDALVDRPVKLDPLVAGRTGPRVFLGYDVVTMLVYTMLGSIDNSANNSELLFDKIVDAIRSENFSALDDILAGFENPTAIAETLASILTLLKYLEQGKVVNIQRRVLWLADDEYKNKIITFKTNSNKIVSRIEVEAANDGDATLIQSGGGPKSMMEYQWVDGNAIPAQTRLTPVQKPLFRIYDRNQIAFDQWQAVVGHKPSRLASTIVEFVESGSLDPESGYKLAFLPSQFKNLDPTSAAATAMYDVLLKHTLQEETNYLDSSGTDKSVPGPYNFRRLQSVITEEDQDLNSGLSFGYRRAWFRLRSWASNVYDLSTYIAIDDKVNISLPVSAWPSYEWNITFVDGSAKVLHPDNLENSIDNILVGAVGENLTLNTIGVDTIELVDTDNTVSLLTQTVDVAGTTVIVIPDNIVGGFYDLVLNGTHKLRILLINAKVDPRAPVINVNGLEISYEFVITRDSENWPTELSVDIFAETGIVEIKHQGEFSADSDHATSLPGLEYNTLQNIDLGEFSPSRFASSFFKCIRSNSENATENWINGTQLPALDGALMTDVSDLRAVWLANRSEPTLSETLISRSMSAWRWYRRFMALLDRYNNIYDLPNENRRVVLDRLLEELSTGINYSQPDAVSGMAFTTNAMNYRQHIGNGIAQQFEINTGDQQFYQGVFGPDHIYVYLNEQLLSKDDYYIQDKKVGFLIPLAEGAVLDIYHSGEEFVFSGIPASPAKLGLTGVVRPEFVRETWGDVDRILIRRHDGSRIVAYQEHNFTERDPRDLIILELETRIYNACRNIAGDPQRQLLDRFVLPKTITPSRARAALQWFSANNIDYRDRRDFVEDDLWTWNYNGKSWRAIYLENFGTVRLHTHPWEALGYQDKPSWWDIHYSWADSTKRSALESALSNGKISVPGESDTFDFRVKRYHPLGFPVSSSGKLLDPVAWGLPAPSIDQARAPWDIGSISPIEDVWLRSSAGSWARVIDAATNLKTSSEFVERSINPFVVPNRNNSPMAIGSTTMAPNNFIQDRPTIGVGAVLFETNRELNLLGESPLLEMTLINPVLMFGLGGYGSSTARFRMYHTRYQNGNYVPEEDYALTLNNSVPVQKLRYSAVRLEKDDTGFRVYGYDPENRYFEIATPIKTGATGGVTGSFQQAISTPSGSYTNYRQWNTTAPSRIDYGHLFADKQEVFEFFSGIEELQKSQGLIFDQPNERGGIDNWRQACIDAFGWVEENWNGEHYVVVSPASSSAGFKFQHSEGQLDRLDSDLLRNGKIIFSNGQLAQNNDLLITRDYEPQVDLIQPIGSKQIVFADIKVRKFDHVFYFNSKTRFNDVIVDNQSNQRLDYFDIVARRSKGWTGRFQANGQLIDQGGVLPGFDALVSDIIESRRPEKSQFDSFVGNLAKSNIVPSKDSVLREVILDPSVEFQYKQGLQSASGTNLAFDAFLRNSAIDLPGKTQDLSINEQWLFNDGEFGRLGGRKIWEIELRKEDVNSDRQVVRFLEGRNNVDLRSDNIIDIIGKQDSRWVNRDPIDIEFASISRNAITKELIRQQGWLPSAGAANVDFTDIEARDITSITKNDLILGDNAKIKRLFEIRSFSKFQTYDPEDLVWNEGKLYKSNTTVTGGENTAFDPTQWDEYTGEPAVAQPPSIWVSDYNFANLVDLPGDSDTVGWNVLQMLGPFYVEECCPNALNTSLNESKVTFANSHKLKTGDVFLMTGSGDGNYDRFHVVKKVVDDFNVLIEGRSTGNTIVYNIVAFRLASMKFGSEESLRAADGDGFVDGMLGYVEEEDEEGNGIGKYQVYRRENGAWVPGNQYTTVEDDLVDSHLIESVSLLDATNENLLATIEVFDPFKGLTIDEVAQYITYRDGADPAVYNIDELGVEDLDVNSPWGEAQLGTLWWDTGRVRYLEYEQGSLNYKIQNWGKQFADSQVIVYEWAKTDELPQVDSTPDARLDMSNGVGAIRFSEIDSEDPVTGAVTTHYYYWKANSSTLPENSTRKYTALDIQSVLNDPNVAGVTWMSPIDSNALLIANLKSYLTARDSVILRIEQKIAPEQQHTNAILVSEGFTGDVVPEYLYRRLRASITGRDNYRKSFKLKTWEPNTAYEQGDYVINWTFSQIDRSDSSYGSRDIPIIRVLDDGREEVTAILKPILDDTDIIDAKLHRIFFVREEGYISSGDFRQDYLDEHIVVSATSALIQGILESEDYRAVVVSRRRVPDPRLHPLRRYGNAYTPIPQTWFKDIREARRNLVRSANAYLLKINAVNKDHWDAHLREYRPLFGPYIKDLEPYWRYVDYLAEGYEYGAEQLLVENSSEVLDYEQSTGEEITLYGLVDSNGVIQQSFAKSGLDTTLVYQRDGTIQFNDSIWDGTLGDAWDMSRWDRYAWDEDNSEVVESLLTALREDLFVGEDIGYFNLTFFDMVKESLRQIPNANWVTKTTYLNISQFSNNDLTPVSIYFDRRDTQIKQYVNEVKPYHSKIIDVNQSLNTIENIGVNIEESIVLLVDYEDYILTDEAGNMLTDENEKPLIAVDTRSEQRILVDGESDCVDCTHETKTVDEDPFICR